MKMVIRMEDISKHTWKINEYYWESVHFGAEQRELKSLINILVIANTMIINGLADRKIFKSLIESKINETEIASIIEMIKNHYQDEFDSFEWMRLNSNNRGREYSNFIMKVAPIFYEYSSTDRLAELYFSFYNRILKIERGNKFNSFYEIIDVLCKEESWGQSIVINFFTYDLSNSIVKDSLFIADNDEVYTFRKVLAILDDRLYVKRFWDLDVAELRRYHNVLVFIDKVSVHEEIIVKLNNVFEKLKEAGTNLLILTPKCITTSSNRRINYWKYIDEVIKVNYIIDIPKSISKGKQYGILLKNNNNSEIKKIDLLLGDFVKTRYGYVLNKGVRGMLTDIF